MSAPHICLRCRRRLLQKRQFARGIGFVSLSQNIRQSGETLPADPKTQGTDSHNGRSPGNATKERNVESRRPVKRAPLSSLGMDSVLESLFSSQQEKQLKPTPTSYSGTPVDRVRPSNAEWQPETLARSDRSSGGQLQSSSRLKQIIAGYQRQEKQIADAIIETELLLNRPETPFFHDEGATQLDGDRQPRKWNEDYKVRWVTTIIKNVERATKRYDVARVAQLWQKYQQSSDNARLDLNSREAIYSNFLTAFVTLSRQEQAVHVWNDMLQAKITPNKKHWNAMLKGCSKVHDVRSLQEIWDNMITAGIEPDQVLWTTYIHGLILCGKWQRGLQVLDDLGKRWNIGQKTQRSEPKNKTKTAQNPHNPSTAYDPHEPSLAPVQAALTALTVTQRHELCIPLLDWAKAHSLILTTEIFNILLRPAVRAGDTDKIAYIFSLMKTNSCPPDEATYTILLNGHLSSTNPSFSLLSPQQQQDSVLRILDDMTANKIAVDKRTYGTILRNFLSSESGKSSKDDAARAVLDHMTKNNVPPDSYIYHMLVTYHFSGNPPDIAAIETIWARIKIERPSLQSIFYEKMVEGYASVNAVEKMMFFLMRIAKEGNSPRWRCLTDVLNTLVETGEWGLARELVEDVRDGEKGLMRYADRNIGSMAKEEFWGIVDGIKDQIEL
ncbi:MAG: hypothetical protein Q9170_007169, partial [Blastenia crenularia]